MPSYSINVDVPLVSVDALVLTKDGQFIPGLQKEQFRILEDNVVQPIQSFGLTKAGYTAVLLVEFASTPAFQVSRRQFLYDALRASYAFTDQMQKNDYVSVISYDLKPSILVDFTSDKAGDLRCAEHATHSRASARRISSTHCTTPWTGWTALTAARKSF